MCVCVCACSSCFHISRSHSTYTHTQRSDFISLIGQTAILIRVSANVILCTIQTNSFSSPPYSVSCSTIAAYRMIVVDAQCFVCSHTNNTKRKKKKMEENMFPYDWNSDRTRSMRFRSSNCIPTIRCHRIQYTIVIREYIQTRLLHYII